MEWKLLCCAVAGLWTTIAQPTAHPPNPAERQREAHIAQRLAAAAAAPIEQASDTEVLVASMNQLLSGVRQHQYEEHRNPEVSLLCAGWIHLRGAEWTISRAAAAELCTRHLRLWLLQPVPPSLRTLYSLPGACRQTSCIQSRRKQRRPRRLS